MGRRVSVPGVPWGFNLDTTRDPSPFISLASKKNRAEVHDLTRFTSDHASAHAPGVDETDLLKKKAQSMLPDLNLVLEQLRSGDGGGQMKQL